MHEAHLINTCESLRFLLYNDRDQDATDGHENWTEESGRYSGWAKPGPRTRKAQLRTPEHSPRCSGWCQPIPVALALAMYKFQTVFYTAQIKMRGNTKMQINAKYEHSINYANY